MKYLVQVTVITLNLYIQRFYADYYLSKKSTNVSALYGDLGRVPLIVVRKIRMIKYWIKILNLNNNTILYKVYQMLKKDANNNLVL